MRKQKYKNKKKKGLTRLVQSSRPIRHPAGRHVTRPPAAPRPGAQEPGQASNEEKNKMQLSATRGNRTWNLLLVLSMANHYATLTYILSSIRLFNSLYYLATRQLWTMYISNVVNSYKIFCQNYTSIKRLYVLNMNFIQFFESIQVAHVVQIGISFYKHTEIKLSGRK